MEVLKHEITISEEEEVSRRARTIWMGNISSDWNEEFIISLFCAITVTPVKVTIKCNARKGWKDSTGKRVGFALIEFKSIEEVTNVLEHLSGELIPGTNQNFNIKPHKYESTTDNNDELLSIINHSYANESILSLRNQLDPLNISQLRERLLQFGFDSVELEQRAQRIGGRIARKAILVDKLCRFYNEQPNLFSRREIFVAGKPVRDELIQPLLNCLRETKWLTGKKRNVNSSEYLVLGVPCKGASPKNIDIFPLLWELASAVLQDMDPSFSYSSLAVTKNFVGSPHVDMNDTSPQYAISLGDFCNGGELCVEASPHEIYVIDTKCKFAKLDGRYPHWVKPYEGERYSLIYYQVNGESLPKEAAVYL
jgi:RNA recognition motif-containing protein